MRAPRLAITTAALLTLVACGEGSTPTTAPTSTASTPTTNPTATPSTPTTTPTTPTSTGPVPTLPTTLLGYSDAASPLPVHFTTGGPGGPPSALDNSTPGNAITDAGATLGRVLFYDKRLSANDQISCGSCHLQQVGFADTARLSRGFKGGLTGRHSMSLGNARFYQNGRFFWDERAVSLEDQVLRPIQDTVEMGMTLPALETKLSATSFYPALFQSAFGTSTITSDRIARALAQFVRSMTTTRSRFDAAFVGAQPNFGVLTAEEQLGQSLFAGVAGCARCHTTVAQIGDRARNTGLDATITDVGAGNGTFKVSSLRNVGVRSRFMHDGRFTTLDAVVEFYATGVQNNPNLDQRLRTPNGQVQRLNLSPTDKSAIVAFLRTLTDSTFLRDVRFSDPFPKP
ncbi:MAG: cytochrome-c peroxidase [Gemmatimonadaceae bacterium]|nr:cytochrome-c peroxidase [Gemmatimonadaceae bacterium]